MKHQIEFTQEQYQELIEIVFLGEFIKKVRVVPESFEQMINLPSTKLKNYLFSKAKEFNSEQLIEHIPELEGQLNLFDGEKLIEKYFDL